MRALADSPLQMRHHIFDGLTGGRFDVFDRDELVRYDEIFKQESDRGAVLVAAAMLDDLVSRRVENMLGGGNKEARKRLLKPPLGALSSFSSKVDFLFCSAEIPSSLYRDFRMVGALRNQCAHHWHDFTLSAEVVDPYLETMFFGKAVAHVLGTIPQEKLDAITPRVKFQTMLCCLLTGANMYDIRLLPEEERPSPRPDDERPNG